MRWLELRVPPVALAVTIAAAMWLAAPPGWYLGEISPMRATIAAALGAIGVTVAVAGTRAFRRARTTVNPLRPESASSLVVGGVYRHTRNPMYAGIATILLGWAVALSAAVAFAGPALFVAWITRFQIVPEERALAAAFGPEFAAYCRHVRRWL